MMRQEGRTGKIKARLAALAFCCLLSLSAGTAFADSPMQPGAPGCNKAMWGIQINFADVSRLKDFALSTLMKEADSVLAATCFDQALALSSRLGAIFSDLSPDEIVGAVKTYVVDKLGTKTDSTKDLLDNLYNPLASLGLKLDPGKLIKGGTDWSSVSVNTLSHAMNKVVTGPLTNYLGGGVIGQGAIQNTVKAADNAVNAANSTEKKAVADATGALQGEGNFAQALTNDMGANITGALNGLVSDIDGVFDKGTGTLGSIMGVNSKLVSDLSKIDDLMQDAEWVICALGATQSALASVVYTVVAVVTQVISVLGQFGAILGGLKNGLTAIKEGITDVLSPDSLLGGVKASLSGLDFPSLDGIPSVSIPTLPAVPSLPDLSATPIPTSLPSLPDTPTLPGALPNLSLANLPQGVTDNLKMPKPPSIPKLPSKADLESGAASAIAGCPLANALWKGGIDGATGELKQGIIGGGPTKGIPFFNYRDLVSVKVTALQGSPGTTGNLAAGNSNAPPAASSGNLMEAIGQNNWVKSTSKAIPAVLPDGTTKVIDSLTQNVNNNLLTAAGKDLANLASPGTLSFWSKPKQTLPANPGSCQIIAQMKDPTGATALPTSCCVRDPSQPSSASCP